MKCIYITGNKKFAEETRMKLVTVPEMLAIEKEADASGLTYALMMENAGRGLADVILETFFDDGEGLEALGIVGPGNNGGDTLVALEHLANNGWVTYAYLVKRKSDEYAERLETAGGKIFYGEKDKNFESLKTFIERGDHGEYGRIQNHDRHGRRRHQGSLLLPRRYRSRGRCNIGVNSSRFVHPCRR